MAWELDFLNFIADNLHTGILDKFFVLLTTLGNGGVIWMIVTMLLLMSKSTRRAGIASAAALVFMLISVNIIIKPMADRIRPFAADTTLLRAVLIRLPGDASFPSGHTAAGFAAATAVFLYRKRIGIILFILALLIGVSRLYLCVHFPTDVVFGALIGIVMGIGGYYFSVKITQKNIDKAL